MLSKLKTDRLSLGWIEIFIQGIRDAPKKAPRAVKEMIDVANVVDPSIEKLIYKLQNANDRLLLSFEQFRKPDNSYLSHKSAGQMPQSETLWLYTYAISDFKSFYDLSL